MAVSIYDIDTRAIQGENMNDREQRGLMIAASCRINRKGAIWLVPSQSGNGTKYTVSLDQDEPHCTCPDHELRGCRCKHIYAAQYVFEREFDDDGGVVETETLVVQKIRKSYPQQWPAYNAAQTTEKATLQTLLHDLCNGLPEYSPTGPGRPRLPLRDALFCAVFKVYSMLSSRRFTSDLCDAHSKGYISRVPHFNSVLNVFDSEETTPILKAFVEKSAAPLASIETNFAVDSTGFSGCRFDCWLDTKFKQAQTKSSRAWQKAHAMIGTKTNIVTAVEVLPKESSDMVWLQPLMHTTAQRFTIGDLTADKGYLSVSNLQAISDIGANGFIPFKINSNYNSPGIWNNAFHFFNLHREEFLRRYHVRSNVESTFSMIKRKFGDSVKAKNDVSMRNEILAKFVCHNLSCLIHATEEFGIDPSFGCTNITSPAQILTPNWQ